MNKLLRSDKIFITIVFCLFIIFCTINILNHEMWRDEITVWMVANYNSIPGIFNSIKVQVQPVLWYLVVKAVQQIFPNPSGIAFANLFFIALTVIILLKYAPFNRLQKGLLCFSYFILYEYGTIARNYAMSLFFIFAICALYPQRKKYIILIVTLLVIICNIQIMNIIIAIWVFFLLVAENIFLVKSKKNCYIQKSHLIISGFILTIGVFLALKQAIPPADSPWALSATQKWLFHSPVAALTTVWLSFVPISRPIISFWNTNILPYSSLMILLSLLILFLSCLFFIRKPLICSFYILGVMAFIAFFYKFYHGFTRHHGYIFIIFVMAYWISHNFMETGDRNLLTRLNKHLFNHKFNLFTFVCFIHFIAVFVPIYFEWQYPFSASRDAAYYLRSLNSQDFVLLGDVDFCVAPIAALVDREFYYPVIQDYAKAAIWDHPNRKRISLEDMQKKGTYHQYIKRNAKELAQKTKKDVIMVLNYPLDEKPIKEFSTAIVPDERYFIYRVKHHPSHTKINNQLYGY